jgi:hypothetical protein
LVSLAGFALKRERPEQGFVLLLQSRSVSERQSQCNSRELTGAVAD